MNDFNYFKTKEDIGNILLPGRTFSNIPHFYLTFRALVVDNEDPERMGRVRVYIPEIMDDKNVGTDKKEKSIWARPANNIFGGRKIVPEPSTEYSFQGTSFIPVKDSWWVVYFEDGNPNKCFYLFPLNHEHFLMPPESILGSNYWDKWVLFRSPDGRSIVVSDDSDDERVEITGRKKNIPTGDKKYSLDFIRKHTTEHVQRINLNQKTILIDDRDGKEKILIADDHGNYINIDTQNDHIYVHSMKDTRIYAEGKIYISVLDDAHIRCNKDIYMYAETGENGGGNFHLYADKNIYMNADKDIHIKAGGSIYNQAGGSIHEKAGGNYYQTSGGATHEKAGGAMIMTASVIHENGPTAASASSATKATKAKGAEMKGDRHFLDKWKNYYNQNSKSANIYKKDDRDYPKLDGDNLIDKYIDKFLNDFREKIKRRKNTKNSIL